jgi:hypothetical protein
VRSTILLGRMDSSSEEPSQAQESFGNQVSARAWVALFVLMLVYASNQASRYLLTYVVNFDASNAGAAKVRSGSCFSRWSAALLSTQDLTATAATHTFLFRSS